jgi:Uma2 family endonuclease
MSAVLKFLPPTTLAEFLAWEQGQEVRHEWDGVQPIAMVGGTLAHSELATRLSDRLRDALRDRGCTVFRADVKVWTERGSRVRYPDLVVTCSPIRPSDTAVRDPVLIVEVLSESTAGVDLGIKRAEYAALPSLRRYVVLSNEAALAFVFTAANDFRGEEVREVLDLPELGVSVPLAPIYAGLLRETGAASGEA